MSVNDEGDQFPSVMPEGEGGEGFVVMPGEGRWGPPDFFREGGRIPAEMLRAAQPAGAVFALGWLLAELFDLRRRASVSEPTPPFDPVSQLPLAADLAADPKLVFLAAQLSELLRWFPRLHRPLRLVTAQTNKKKAVVAAENLATAEAAGEAQADDAVPAAAAAAATVGAVAPFSQTEFLAAVSSLHQAILDEFADDPERLCAYQLGLSLSDLAWLPTLGGLGLQSAASRPSGLFGLFARSHLATVHTLLSGAGKQLPAGTAAIVSGSLDNWADWLDVNSARIKAADADTWSPEAEVVLHALRVQGWVWRSVLVADPEVAVQPSMGAWVQAASSIARAGRMTADVIVRRFWPVLVIALLALAGLLYLVISNLSGASQVWASLVTVAAVVGSSTWGIGSGISQSLGGVGYEIWGAAKLDAATWEVTWLPALPASRGERAQLEGRGVAMPQIRKNLDR